MNCRAKEFLNQYKKQNKTWMNCIEQNTNNSIGEKDIIFHAKKDIVSDLNKHIELLEIEKEMIENRIQLLNKEKENIIDTIIKDR